MAVGYLSFGSCFATTAQAVDNFYASQNMEYVALSTTVYLRNRPGNSAGIWYDITERCSYTGGTTQTCTQTSKAARTDVVGSCTYTAPIDIAMDYDVLANMWAFGISIVVALFVLGRGVGMILKLFKDK